MRARDPALRLSLRHVARLRGDPRQPSQRQRGGIRWQISEMRSPVAMATPLQRRSASASTWRSRMTRDLRLALRSLLRRPALSAITVATLALGIGGATALLSAAWTYAIGPSRFVHADRTLVVLEQTTQGTTMPVDLPTARDW